MFVKVVYCDNQCAIYNVDLMRLSVIKPLTGKNQHYILRKPPAGVRIGQRLLSANILVRFIFDFLQVKRMGVH
jgi:hypothetical protein